MSLFDQIRAICRLSVPAQPPPFGTGDRVKVTLVLNEHPFVFEGAVTSFEACPLQLVDQLKGPGLVALNTDEKQSLVVDAGCAELLKKAEKKPDKIAVRHGLPGVTPPNDIRVGDPVSFFDPGTLDYDREIEGVVTKLKDARIGLITVQHTGLEEYAVLDQMCTRLCNFRVGDEVMIGRKPEKRCKAKVIEFESGPRKVGAIVSPESGGVRRMALNSCFPIEDKTAGGNGADKDPPTPRRGVYVNDLVRVMGVGVRTGSAGVVEATNDSYTTIKFADNSSATVLTARCVRLVDYSIGDLISGASGIVFRAEEFRFRNNWVGVHGRGVATGVHLEMHADDCKLVLTASTGPEKEEKVNVTNR